MLGSKKIENTCLISLSGGYGVICSDILCEFGINLPDFREKKETYKELSEIFTIQGTSFNNPIDLAVMIYDPPKVEQAIRRILKEKYTSRGSGRWAGTTLRRKSP